MNLAVTTLPGLVSAQARLDRAAGRIAQAAASPADLADPADPAERPAANDTLAAALVDQRAALAEFKAGWQVFRAQDEMLGTLLDLRA